MSTIPATTTAEPPSSNDQKRDINDFYTLGHVLGDGNFAVVRACTEKATGNEFAVKVINKASLNPKDRSNIKRELQILRDLDHPNIIQLVEVFDDEDKCYIVMELVTGGELFDRIIAKEHYTEEEAKQVIRTVASALIYCHKKDIAHRDLKPENLLYASPDPTAAIKIADFGFAKVAVEGVIMSTMCGTPGYFAPEVIARQPYAKKCDIWSLGVISYILLCGFPPFYDDNQIMEMEKIRQGQYDYPSPYFDHVSPEAKDLINKMLVVDPEKRINAEDVLNHIWLKGETDVGAPTAHLIHVSSNLADNRDRIKAKFKAGVNAILMLNRSKMMAKQTKQIPPVVEESGN